MLDIPGKPVYLPFYWCLICYDCWDVNRVSELNEKLQNLMGLQESGNLCFVFDQSCVIVLANPSKTKHHAEKNATLNFNIAPNLLTLCTLLGGNTNK